MIVKKNIAAGCMALCMSMGIILTGCPNPADEWETPVILPGPQEENPILLPDPELPDPDQKDTVPFVDPNAEKAPEPPDLTTGDSAALKNFLDNTDPEKPCTIRLTADTIDLSALPVKIQGKIFFTTAAHNAVTIKMGALTFSPGSSLQLNPNVTVEFPDSQSPSISHSINYAENSAAQGSILVNTGAALKAGFAAQMWNTAAAVKIYTGGKIIDTSKTPNWAITFTESADFTESNYPEPFAGAPPVNYDAYQVTKYPAEGLALMRKASETRPAVTSTTIAAIADWVPSSTFAPEKYVYLADTADRNTYAGTLKNITGKPLTLVIGQDSTGTRDWWEPGATHVILSGSLAGYAGRVTVNVTKFPVILPHGKLEGASDSRIEVASGAYLDAASKQDDTAGIFHGRLSVKNGGAVRDSGVSNGLWFLGSGSEFVIDYNGRLAAGAGSRTYNASQGWLIGTGTGIPRFRWDSKNEWDLSGWVGINENNMALTGALVVQKDTGINYDVNLAPGATLTIAAGSTLDLGTTRSIYAAKELIGGLIGPPTSNTNYYRPGGNLVLQNGAAVSRAGETPPLFTAAGTYTWNQSGAHPEHSVTINGSTGTFYSLE